MVLRKETSTSCNLPKRKQLLTLDDIGPIDPVENSLMLQRITVLLLMACLYHLSNKTFASAWLTGNQGRLFEANVIGGLTTRTH